MRPSSTLSGDTAQKISTQAKVRSSYNRECPIYQDIIVPELGEKALERILRGGSSQHNAHYSFYFLVFLYLIVTK